MGYNFLSYGCERDFLLPPDARDWLPGGHLPWAVIDAAAALDPGAFLAYYRSDGQGRPAYHPKMMTALVLYCYCKGIRSSRAVQMACFDDVGCRVISGTQSAGRPRHRRPLRAPPQGRAHRPVRAGTGDLRLGGPGDRRPGGRRRHEGEGQRVQGSQPHAGGTLR